MAKLYELAEQFRSFNEFVENALDSEDITEDDLQMYIDTLEGIQCNVEDKVENIVKFLKNIEGDIKAYKAEEERLAKKRKYLNNKFEGLKEYTKQTLEFAKIDKLKVGTFNVRLQKNNPSVAIVNELVIPESYRTPQPDKINNAEILVALKLGAIIEGAMLVDDKRHLRIS
jgi:cell fate (sporulation/competence/biofilm development) regulator YmcA (YheA/YmcA/DUF963 family)